MALKLHPSVTPFSPRQNPNLSPPRSLSVTVSNRHLPPLRFFAHSLSAIPRLTLFHRTRFRTTARAIRGQELTGDGLQQSSTEEHHGQITEDEEEEEEEGGKKELTKQDMWSQMKEIAMFTGPAVGLWICGPLMSLIDTAVIGQGSSIELAALGIQSS